MIVKHFSSDGFQIHVILNPKKYDDFVTIIGKDKKLISIKGTYGDYDVSLDENQLVVGCRSMKLIYLTEVINFLKTKNIQFLEKEQVFYQKNGKGLGIAEDNIREITDNWIITKSGKAYKLSEYSKLKRVINIHDFSTYNNNNHIEYENHILKKRDVDFLLTILEALTEYEI